MITPAEAVADLAALAVRLTVMREELEAAITAKDQATLDRVSGQIRAMSDTLKPPGGVDAVVL